VLPVTRLLGRYVSTQDGTPAAPGGGVSRKDGKPVGVNVRGVTLAAVRRLQSPPKEKGAQ